MVWLPVFGIFNVCTDIGACNSTQRLCGHHKRVCTESWLEKKSLAAPGIQICVSIVPGFSVRHSTSWANPTPFSISLSLTWPQSQKHLVTSWNLKHLDTNRFQSDMKAVCISMLSTCVAEDLVAVYNTSMHQVLDNHAPQKTRCVPVHLSTPWIMLSRKGSQLYKTDNVQRNLHKTR